MLTPISSIHESDNSGQALLNEVVQHFTDLLVASGATLPMIESAMHESLAQSSSKQNSTRFTVLGSLLRDCMEVMCLWRRDPEFTGPDGGPLALGFSSDASSFLSLCNKAACRQPPTEVLRALVDFGAVAIGSDGYIRSETPTFILGRASLGGCLATDALLKHLEGFLLCVHRNVRSVSGDGKPKFERACTVTVAAELEPIFDQLVRRRGQDFIDAIDEWLERHARQDSPTGTYVELGAGAYYVDFGQRQARKSRFDKK
jgi:hypothetical protein